MKKENIEKYYKNSYLIISTITLYSFIMLFKNMFYLLFNVNLKVLTNNEISLANITYQIFAITISIYFFIKNKNETLDKFINYLKKILIGISSILFYSLTSFLELFVLYCTKVNIKTMSITSKTIYLISFEILIMAIIALINHKTLEKCIKNIKLKNYESYISYYVLALFLMALSNFLINMISPSIAANEQTVRNTLQKAPIYMFFSASLFAPFTEEMIFRQSIRNIIKNKYIFIISSGLIFGGLHVIGNINTLTDILYIIPYSIPGFIFAYMLVKSNNILIPMGFHFLHNTFLIILQLIKIL